MCTLEFGEHRMDRKSHNYEQTEREAMESNNDKARMLPCVLWANELKWSEEELWNQLKGNSKDKNSLAKSL